MIQRAKRKTNYTIMSNVGLTDERLSWKARGLLAYLLSKPDDWRTNDRQLTKAAPEGRTAVQSGLKELEEYGYLVRKKIRDKDGTFSWESTVYDEPWTENPATVKASTDNQATIISTLETSTDVQSTDGNLPRGAKRTQAHPMTTPILESYAEKCGYEINYAREGKAAKEIAQAGYTPEQMADAYAQMKADKFWAARHLPLQKVLEQLPALAHYTKNGAPKVETEREKVLRIWKENNRKREEDERRRSSGETD